MAACDPWGSGSLRGTPVIAAAFIAACRAELEAPKPGNVHVFARGHGMEMADFIASAEAAAPCIAAPGAKVGKRILDAVEATFAAVGQNTNLGIILLCAPIAAAAEQGGDLRAALARVLAGLDVDDAARAFRAIARASPGGLGAAEHDVRAPACITLLQAMREAAGRDQIAAQYASGFAGVFGLGLPALHNGLRRWNDPKWATLAACLAFLQTFPDSHIQRKYGLETALGVQKTAAEMAGRLSRSAAPETLLPALLQWDGELKARRINPGTSADLTVATLFADRLRNRQQLA